MGMRSRAGFIALVSLLVLLGSACARPPLVRAINFDAVQSNALANFTLTDTNDTTVVIDLSPVPLGRGFTGTYKQVPAGTWSFTIMNENTSAVLAQGQSVFSDDTDYSLMLLNNGTAYLAAVTTDDNSLSASSTSAMLHLINASPDLGALSSSVAGGATVATSIPFGHSSTPVSLAAGTYSLTVTNGVNSYQVVVSLQSGRVYSLGVLGLLGSGTISFLLHIDSGVALVRVIHAANGVSPVTIDVDQQPFITDPLSFGQITPYTPLRAAAQVSLEALVGASVASAGTFTFPDASFFTVALIQGANTLVSFLDPVNSNNGTGALVRAVNLIPSVAVDVSARTTSEVIATNLQPLAVGSYVSVTPGTNTIDVTNPLGANLTSVAQTFAAGSVQSVFVFTGGATVSPDGSSAPTGTPAPTTAATASPSPSPSSSSIGTTAPSPSTQSPAPSSAAPTTSSVQPTTGFGSTSTAAHLAWPVLLAAALLIACTCF